MDDQPKWDRREEDRKARINLNKALSKVEEKFERSLEQVTEEVEELREFLRGGPNNQDPLGTRVHLVEVGLTELRILVKGDALGRNSLKEMVKMAQDDAKEALGIAKGKVEHQTTRRGQNVSVIVAVISLLGVMTMATLSNWDKIYKAIRRETPQEKLERIQHEIEEEKKVRGPEIQKKLREIERAARWRPS